MLMFFLPILKFYPSINNTKSPLVICCGYSSYYYNYTALPLASTAMVSMVINFLCCYIVIGQIQCSKYGFTRRNEYCYTKDIDYVYI